MRKIVAIAFATLVCVAAHDVCGQVLVPAAIEGTIVDAREQPLAGASITLVYEPDGAAYTATSDGDGTYRIEGFKPGGPYVISVSLEGRKPTGDRDLFIKPGRILKLNFKLEIAE